MSHPVTRPMLAETCEDISTLKYPVIASIKLDGIRCIKINGQALSRKFKPIPNDHIRGWIERNCSDGFDGEIICPGKTFNETQSAVMKKAGEPDFKYYVFDWVQESLDEPFLARIARLKMNQTNRCFMIPQGSNRCDTASSVFPQIHPDKVVILDQVKIDTQEQLEKFEAEAVEKGEEGVMVRSLNGPYKCGRSTVREGYLLKIKRFEDAEAEIIDFMELQHNNNEAETNELGLTKRSTKKEGMVGGNTLGKFVVREVKTGIEFEIGTGLGLDQKLRKEIWDNRSNYFGRIVKFKYQKCGSKDKFRFPVWLGFRSLDDMGE